MCTLLRKCSVICKDYCSVHEMTMLINTKITCVVLARLHSKCAYKTVLIVLVKMSIFLSSTVHSRHPEGQPYMPKAHARHPQPTPRSFDTSLLDCAVSSNDVRLYTLEPRFNEVPRARPRDWPITRFRCIEVLFHTFYHAGAKNIVRCTEDLEVR